MTLRGGFGKFKKETTEAREIVPKRKVEENPIMNTLTNPTPRMKQAKKIAGHRAKNKRSNVQNPNTNTAR